MSVYQVEVLKFLAGKPKSVAGGIVSPGDVRRDERLAEAVYHLVGL